MSLGVYFYTLEEEIPRHLFKQESVQVVDRFGLHLREVREKKSLTFLSFDKVPDLLIEMVINAEDKRFYVHHGIDYMALSRAFYQNVMHLKKVSGASTLSQQLVRMVFSYERSLLGKLKTMLHALKIESYHTKKEILEFYLNYIPYSYKVRGIAQASEFYFSKEVHSLSPSEMAILVALIRAPTRLSNINNVLDLKSIRDGLLKEARISKEIKEIALKEEIYLYKERDLSYAPHFVRNVLNIALNDGGYDSTITTTLDKRLQESVLDVVKSVIGKLKDKGVTNASVVVLDNDNGEILSYVGSADFYAPGGEYDSVQMKRQPGSTMKPFTYALALQNGYSLSSVLPDIEMYFKTNLGTYKPRNYSLDYTGPRVMREALGNSLNIPALYLASELGVDVLASYLSSFGITFDKDPSYYGVGLTLGNMELSLFDLTQAYMAFANKGHFFKANYIKNRNTEKVITQLEPEVADLVTNILSDKHARKESFGLYSYLDTKIRSSAKTGTSTLYRDNWVVGYTDKLSVGVWVGNTDQKQMNNVTGMSGAGPIYQQVMNIASKKYHSYKVSNFSYEERHICAHSGKLATEFCSRVIPEKFRNDEIPTKSCDFHKNIAVYDCHEFGVKSFVRVEEFPSRYENWAKEYGNGSISDQVYNQCSRDDYHISKISSTKEELKILSPLSGARYAIDPNIPKRLQKIHIEFKRPKNTNAIKLYENDLFLGDVKSSLFHWPIKKGVYELEARMEKEDGSVEKDSVRIFVR